MRYLIHFHPKEKVKPFSTEWTVFDNPPDEIVMAKSDQFTGSSVVLLEFPGTEPLMTLAAARILMDAAEEVKIFKLRDAASLAESDLINAPCVPRGLLEMQEEDFASLPERRPVHPIHPAQDYSNGVIYYGAIIQGQEKIVTSEYDYYAPSAAQSRSVALIQQELSMSNLRPDIVIEYFSGGTGDLPEALFERIRDYIRRYMYFRAPEVYDLLSLWIMGTYIFRVFRYYPYLHLNAEKGSGKTLLMELMAPIAFNGILLSQPAASTALKLIDQSSATLFIDEAEGLSGGNSQLKQILKTGFARSGIFYIGEKRYRTYGPKCFAGINDLDDVLADRTITIKMMRKTSEEPTEIYRENSEIRTLQIGIRDCLYLFGLRYGAQIAGDYESPQMDVEDKLEHLSNRAYDIWAPLYRIANVFQKRDGETSSHVFEALGKLSTLDMARRRDRDREENETGALIQGLSEVLKHLPYLQENEGVRYYDPDLLHVAMLEAEKIPLRTRRKAFSRLLKRVLDIESVPRAFEAGTKRMYAIDTAKFEEYKKRYQETGA